MYNIFANPLLRIYLTLGHTHVLALPMATIIVIAVIGVIAVILALIIIITCIAVCVCKKRKSRQSNEAEDDYEVMDENPSSQVDHVITPPIMRIPRNFGHLNMAGNIAYGFSNN